MRVLGMISGTSHDAIDVAVVGFTLRDDVLYGDVVHVSGTPYPDGLRNRLAAALPPAALTLADVCALDTLIGQAFAEAAAAAVAAAGRVDLLCSHGQTVYHWVESGRALGTLQLGQPAWIAERTGLPVIADVRARDLAAGGHGAPLVPLLDTLLLAGLPGRPAALNLGGIANITVLRPGAGEPLAYDTGPANALIDAAAARVTGGRLRHDAGGALAAAGRVDAALLDDLLAEPYYRLPPPKSTGKELFNAAYLDRAVAGRRTSGVDVVATVTALTAATVAHEVHRHGVDTLVAAGGGCENPTLMAMLGERLANVRLVTSDEFGAPAAGKEAIAFALIGWHTAHGLPAALPTCTGARGRRLLGAVIPGREPLRLPDPLPRPPAALRLRRYG